MTVSPIGTSPVYAPFQSRANFSKNWEALVQALRSNNLDGAKEAYANLTQSDVPQSGAVTRLLNAVGAGLQTGNLDTAQKAVEQGQQPSRPKHHHRHHHDHHHDHHRGADEKRPASASDTATASSSVTITETVTVTVSIDLSVESLQSAGS